MNSISDELSFTKYKNIFDLLTSARKNDETVIEFLLNNFIIDYANGQDFLIYCTEYSPDRIDKIISKWKKITKRNPLTN